MHSDPGKEWQRLTRLYSEMGEGELLELAAGFGDLTAMAQQVLRDEMKKRGLPDPQASGDDREDRQRRFGRWGRAFTEQDRGDSDPEDVPEGEEDSGTEYTWKTLLCQCDEQEHAWQIREMLQQAGIESWIEAPNANALDVTGPRVLVAADQLEEARAIAAQPVPQEIVDQSRVHVEDFVPPSCPQCGARDPLLESVEPVNLWRCETCEAEWSEPAPSPPEKSPFGQR